MSPNLIQILHISKEKKTIWWMYANCAEGSWAKKSSEPLVYGIWPLKKKSNSVLNYQLLTSYFSLNKHWLGGARDTEQ